MAHWAVVAEVYDGIGYSTAVRQVCVLAEVRVPATTPSPNC